MKARKFNLVIFVFLLFSLLPGKVFSLAAPIEEKYWCNSFDSRWSYDYSRSNVSWENGEIILQSDENGRYTSSGVAWMHEVRFSKHIYSLLLSGSYYTSPETDVKVFVSFDNGYKEYPLKWNEKFEPKENFNRIRLKVFLGTNNTNVTPKVSEVCLKIQTQDRSENALNRRDDIRVRGLKQIRNVIDRYYKDFESYPIVLAMPREKEDQWRLLKNVLDSASYNYRKSYNWGFVNQVKGVDTEYKYGYLTGNSGFYYLLWVKLENLNSRHFEKSWKGEILDVKCEPPVYCLSSKKQFSRDEFLRYFEAQERNTQIRGTIFIKTKESPKVWLQINNHRFWLRTPEIFEKAGGKWENVKEVSSLEGISLLKFVQQKNKEDIYLVTETGLKRKLPNSQILSYYGKPSEIVYFEDSRIINVLPNNYLVKSKERNEVYFLDQGIKRWVASQETFKKLGFDWKEVVIIDARELDYYPEATPLF